MRKKSQYRITSSITLTTLLLLGFIGGCSQQDFIKESPTDTSSLSVAKDAELDAELDAASGPDINDSPWIGKTVRELTQGLGDPIQTMDATLRGGPISTAFVYVNNDCTDTYVVNEVSGRVMKYFCR